MSLLWSSGSALEGTSKYIAPLTGRWPLVGVTGGKRIHSWNFVLDHWNLFGIWDLMLGISSFNSGLKKSKPFRDHHP